MDLDLRGRRAVVVGGAHGIGRAVCEAFVAEGADVAVLDLDREAGQQLAEFCRQQRPESHFYSVDVTDAAAWSQSVESLTEKQFIADHLVYAVGIGSGKTGFPFWNLEPEDWPRVLDVNLHGAVRCLSAFRAMLTQRPADACESSVSLLGSIAGQIGSQTDPPYSAAKAALLNFMQCAAKDLAPFRIRVNAICPGMVKTQLNRSVWAAWRDASPENRLEYEAWAEEKIRRIAPLARWQSVEEVAAVAAFLASPHARNITGQAINVDGGQVMH